MPKHVLLQKLRGSNGLGLARDERGAPFYYYVLTVICFVRRVTDKMCTKIRAGHTRIEPGVRSTYSDHCVR